ncbi:FUSC family protein [Demequina salsinemoris]|uniref:FUSC family protein n=1 Tax=Demequina salsinemoris TaxID=577470 RepID=UPI0007847FA3|nr:FUSC family protein [Demequina salsinemoris]
MTIAGGNPDAPHRRLTAAATRAIRSLGDVNQAPHRRWPLGLQAGFTLAAPILIATALGDPQLGFLAGTGAFAALYLAGAKHIDRARFVPVIGAMLLASAALGTATAAAPLATAIGLIAVTALAGIGTQAFALGPPGPIFFVLVYGAASHITAEVDGVRNVEPGLYLACMATGVLFAWGAASFPLVKRRHRIRPTPYRELVPGPVWTPEAAGVAIRVAAVGLVGTILGFALLNPEHAYWTVCAGVAVVGIRARRHAVLSRGLHRVVGTVVGVGVFALLSLLPLGPVGIALLLGALQMAIELIVVRHYALALTLITPLVLLLVSSASGLSGSVIAPERLVDTVVGAGLGVLAALLPDPRVARE